jgi:polyisoprenoid-binding protein YceI
MKRLAFFAGILSLAAPLAVAQTSTWVPDKAHSEVDFSIVHMSLSKVRGHFGPVTGKIVLNESDMSKSSVDVTVDVTGFDSGNSMRDADVKSSSFFDVAKFPTATFVSTSVVKTSSGYTVTGNLTLHGVTKPVVLQVQGPTGPIPGMDHKLHAGYSATANLSRTAFSIGTKYPSSIVGDEVTLTIDLDVVKQ